MTRLLSALAAIALLALPDASIASAPVQTAGPMASQAASQHPAHDRVAALIRAFEKGDIDAFREFAQANYAADSGGGKDIEAAARYWASIYRELGPIKLIRPEALPIPGRRDVVWWVRGTTTQAVVALRVDVEPDAPHRIVRTGVMRGPDPTQGRDPVEQPRNPPAYLDRYLSVAAEGGFFSGVVVVADGDDILFEQAYGWADRESQTPATTATPFRLASVSKMFTGVAIAQLAEQGLLSYQDTIDRFIPEYPSHIGSKVTVHHLLTHTSGIELDRDADYQVLARNATSLEELLSAQVRFIDRLNSGNYENFEPLGRFDYTNEGIDLLGVIVSRASGMPWREYVRRNIFEPAGMENAGTDLLEPVPGLAQGYTSRSEDLRGSLPGTRRPVGDDEIGARLVFRPAGSGYATGRDMLRFLRALQDGRLLTPESVETVTSQQIAQPGIPGAAERGYGYTFNLTSSQQGLRTVGHDGGATGMSTVAEFHPELGTTLVVLSNYDRIANHYAAHVRELLAGASRNR